MLHSHGSSQIALDAALSRDITPEQPFVAGHAERRILLTGATGFLGAWLLRALLEETNAEIVCLARGSIDGAGDRVRRNLAGYGLWTADAEARITVVHGNLAQPALGLESDVYRELAKAVDAIYHAAAHVSWIRPYDDLRQTNVLATSELLRLACTARTKPFHFVSSLSVCYAIGGPASVDERTDMLPHVRRLPLGYAQSKCVAEALVREAAARGLPATIARPSLISGDSSTGTANGDDLIVMLLRGCIEMGTAPDLDWTFDAVPVDVAARAIVRLARSRQHGLETFHLSHPRPRHWRECVLWANVFGYSVQLEPYDRWLQRLERESTRRDHPLRRLLPFFLHRRAGRTTPELFESRSRSRVDRSRTEERERAAGIEYPALDVALLDRYFAAYVASGQLPVPSRGDRPALVAQPFRAALGGPDRPEGLRYSASSGEPGTRIEPLLRAHFADPGLRLASLELQQRGSEHSIIGELGSWRRKAPSGLFHYRATLDGAHGTSDLDLMVKVKPPDTVAIEMAETLAATCDGRVAEALAAVRDEIGLRGSHVREVALYAAPGALKCYMPRSYGTWHDEDAGSSAIILERLTNMAVMDAHASLDAWTGDSIDAAIDGLAGIHAAWLGRESELARQSWIGHVPSSRNVGRLVPLWEALAEHAAARFETYAGPDLVRTHAELVRDVPLWWPMLEALPRTLIHNDFNPRNIGLRHHGQEPRLVAYDWELATVGAPTQDLAEFLCFVLPDNVSAARVARLIHGHRRALERASGFSLDDVTWCASFASALAHVLVARLSFYALIDRVRPQPFLPRVARTWSRLHELAWARGGIAA